MSAVSGVWLVRRKFRADGVDYRPGSEYTGSADKAKRLASSGYIAFEPDHEDKTRARDGRKARAKDASE